MTLFQANDDGYGFEFDPREKQLFFKILSLYPMAPPGKYHVTRHPSSANEEHQRLLEESLAAHQEEARLRVKELMADPQKFVASPNGFRWIVSRGDIEWILQVLNEVRVGSWLGLGSPNLQDPEQVKPTRENQMYYWAMDIAAGFEMIFLRTLSGEMPSQAD